ncbi:MAG: UMP kinase [Planctomycetes bacterium]|nr:UMP kinase [Planctomycetota bacterium]
MKPKYKRVLLKISGEGLCATGSKGFDIDEIRFLARELISVRETNTQIGVVIGGGNIVRGSQLSGINQPTGDYMGMLATVINALALQDVLESMGAETRVLTAIPMEAVAEPFIRRRCIRHMEKGRIVILAGGTGNPHFTTDTAAALRATEIKADALLKATKVDGVFTSDPHKDANAKKYEKLAYLDVINQKLKVMDSTAISMCMENKLPIIVFNLKKAGNIVKAVKGEKIGTVISD